MTETICRGQNGNKKMFAMYAQRQSSVDDCKKTIDVTWPCTLNGSIWPGPVMGIISQRG